METDYSFLHTVPRLASITRQAKLTAYTFSCFIIGSSFLLLLFHVMCLVHFVCSNCNICPFQFYCRILISIIYIRVCITIKVVLISVAIPALGSRFRIVCGRAVVCFRLGRKVLLLCLLASHRAEERQAGPPKHRRFRMALSKSSSLSLFGNSLSCAAVANTWLLVGFEVLTTVVIFWDMVPYS